MLCGRPSKPSLRRYFVESGTWRRQLAGLLRDLLRSRGVEADADLAVLERGWSMWLEAEARGDGLVVETWDAPFDLASAMKVDPVDFEVDLATPRGRELLRRLLEFEYRSDATALLEAARAEELTPGELVDVETVASWYTDARHRAFAVQHRCDFAHPEPMDGPAIGVVRRALARAASGQADAAPASVTMPAGMLDAFSTMSGEEFHSLTATSREPLAAWWATGDASDLSRLVDAIDSRLAKPASAATDSPALAQMLAKVVAAGVGLGASAAGAPVSFAVFAALVSDAVMATRERRRTSKTRTIRKRIVEYGLHRIGSQLR